MTFDSMDSFESLDDITARFASQGLDIEGNVQDCTTCGRQLGTDPAVWVRPIGVVHDTPECRQDQHRPFWCQPCRAYGLSADEIAGHMYAGHPTGRMT